MQYKVCVVYHLNPQKNIPTNICISYKSKQLTFTPRINSKYTIGKNSCHLPSSLKNIARYRINLHPRQNIWFVAMLNLSECSRSELNLILYTLVRHSRRHAVTNARRGKKTPWCKERRKEMTGQEKGLVEGMNVKAERRWATQIRVRSCENTVAKMWD